MGAKLVVVAGPDKGTLIPLTEGRTVQLGRGQQADFLLNDLYISRLHCRIVLRGDHVVVTDLASAGGTYVNGEPIAERAVRPGEDLQLGETHLNLRLVSAAAADAATIAPPMAEEVVADEALKPTEFSRPQTAVPPKPKTKAVPALPSERLTELTGQMLAHYEVGKLLGRGKSGLVFRAVDREKDLPVALKVLWPESTRDDAEMQRFVRSMKTALTLRHPNIVSVLGAGKKGPYCYIAMEFVEGESLTQMIQRLGIANRVDWRHVFRINTHLARALVFAHERQIIHRNITPQNVMVRAADKAALLSDLFLAKAMEGGLAAHLTRAGEVLGDVRFMAPERLEGQSYVDHRSDIYSLGALIYTLLAGQPPFDGATLLDIITKVRTGKPEDVKKFQMGVPESFNGVVQRMLGRRPEERYQETTKLVEDLERLATFVGVPV